MQLSGDAERPRLAVFRSNEHIYAQVCIQQRQSRPQRRPHGARRGEEPSSTSSQICLLQVIDDVKGHTLASASTLVKDVKAAIEGNGANTAAAAAVGKKIAEAAKAAGVTKVAFDRGGFAYHGRIQVPREKQ
jgi:large subunit ribosomal protein L18